LSLFAAAATAAARAGHRHSRGFRPPAVPELNLERRIRNYSSAKPSPMSTCIRSTVWRRSVGESSKSSLQRAPDHARKKLEQAPAGLELGSNDDVRARALATRLGSFTALRPQAAASAFPIAPPFSSAPPQLLSMGDRAGRTLHRRLRRCACCPFLLRFRKQVAPREAPLPPARPRARPRSNLKSGLDCPAAV